MPSALWNRKIRSSSPCPSKFILLSPRLCRLTTMVVLLYLPFFCFSGIVFFPKQRDYTGRRIHRGTQKAYATHRLRPNRTVLGGDLTSSGTLRGSKRVRTKCYFVSGVIPDSTEEQTRSYCNKRSVQTTGCYLLRSRNWGTQSAKLFVVADCSDAV